MAFDLEDPLVGFARGTCGRCALELTRRIHAVYDYTLLSEAKISAPFFVRIALSHAISSGNRQT